MPRQDHDHGTDMFQVLIMISIINIINATKKPASPAYCPLSNDISISDIAEHAIVVPASWRILVKCTTASAGC